MPKADAGPLNGALWPMVISVSVTPARTSCPAHGLPLTTPTRPRPTLSSLRASFPPDLQQPLDGPVARELKTVRPACKQKFYHLLGNAMAEILALGISHYPPLWGPDDRMCWILKRMLQNPKLPQELRTPDGWPEAMRAEWGNDEGTSSAARHREKLVGWLNKTRAALDAFKPDFVLMWGDDQYENFKEDVVPPYCI